MGMVQVLHYYCKRRRSELLNDITFKKGISCQIQTDFLDISDIVKELTNKNHIDCGAIDEDLFGIGDIEDIISKLEVLKFVTDETKILIIALDRMRNDEMIQGIQKSGVVDYIITKEMIEPALYITFLFHTFLRETFIQLFFYYFPTVFYHIK